MENDSTPTRTSESTVPPPGPLVEVIQRMQKIRDGLDPHDGVACFNSMRLIQGGPIDLVRHLLSCNDQPSIKIAE